MSVPAGSSRSNKGEIRVTDGDGNHTPEQVPQGSPVEEALDRLEGCITRVKDGTISVGRTSEEDADAALATVRAELERLTEERDSDDHARGYRDGVREERKRNAAEVSRLTGLLERHVPKSWLEDEQRDHRATKALLEHTTEGLRHIEAVATLEPTHGMPKILRKARSLLAVSSRPSGDTARLNEWQTCAHGYVVHTDAGITACPACHTPVSEVEPEGGET